MSYTQADVDCLDRAILKKAKGERLTALDLGGRLEQFADAPLDALMRVRDWIVGIVAGTARRSKIIRTTFDKGLYR